MCRELCSHRVLTTVWLKKSVLSPLDDRQASSCSWKRHKLLQVIKLVVLLRLLCPIMVISIGITVKVFFLDFCCTMPGNFLEPLTLCIVESIMREKEYSKMMKLGLHWELFYLFMGTWYAYLSLQARHCGMCKNVLTGMCRPMASHLAPVLFRGKEVVKET